MRISSIDIKNFRVFDTLKVDDFSQINIILGRNNAGKTALMEAVLLSISSTYPMALFELNQIREISERSLSNIQSFFHNLSFDNSPVIDAVFTDQDGDQTQRQINVKAVSEIPSTLPVTAQLEHRRDSTVSFNPTSQVNQINVTTSFSGSEKVVVT